MKIRYFAWIREKIGKEEETVNLPGHIGTVAQLIEWLRQQDEGYASALEDTDTLRVALDQIHAEHDASIKDVSEIAIFPPMTGG